MRVSGSLLLMLAAAAILIGCATAASNPAVLARVTAAETRPEMPARLQPAEIEMARRLYVAKCAKCHRLHDPNEFSTGDWATWMRKMARKSSLAAEQERVLTVYLEVYRQVTAGR